MSASKPPRKVPELLVEQLALGELDGERAAKVRSDLADDDALARIEASNQEILADYPPERIAAEIQRRAAQTDAGRKPARSVIPWLLVPTMVAAAALVWIVVRDEPETTIVRNDLKNDPKADDKQDTTRIKGGAEPHLVVDRRTADGHERLAANDRVREGDLLQVSYVPAGARAGVIVSIDGAGTVTLHHPSDAATQPTLDEGSEVPLAHSYELDDAPGFERFLFVTRDGPPPTVAEVMRAAEQLAADPQRARSELLELQGKGWQQHSLLLRKAPVSAEGDAPSPTPAGTNDPGQGQGAL